MALQFNLVGLEFLTRKFLSKKCLLAKTKALPSFVLLLRKMIYRWWILNNHMLTRLISQCCSIMAIWSHNRRPVFGTTDYRPRIDLALFLLDSQNPILFSEIQSLIFKARAQAARASTSLYFLVVLVFWHFSPICVILRFLHNLTRFRAILRFSYLNFQDFQNS